MAQPKTTHTYQAMGQELEAVITALQQDDIDVDEALKQYARGLELVTLLQNHLASAENKITELQAAFNTKAK